jgi:Ca-activated chloride channel family protein
MRKTLLSLGLVALLGSGCASAAMTTDPNRSQPPPEHHQPTPRPFEQPTPPPFEPPTPPPFEQPPATPYDGVTYQDPGINPFIDPDVDRESTFGLDVDTASYTIAQRYIDDGNLPDPASVRVEEYVNFFDQEYAPPQDDTFAIHVDGGPTPFLAPDETLLRIGVKAREVGERSRPSAALTFVIDVSGSMAREDRLELVKQSLGFLVEGLRPDDSVAIVVYGTEARVVLGPTSGRDGGTILAAIGSLQPEGSTNAEAGLRLGYQVAREQFRDEAINRVVLASDGVANVGATSPEEILGRVRDDAESGIQLVAVGVGMGNFNDALLEQLADQGDGFYAYVNDLSEARRLFVDDLTGTLESVALDARVQVEFDPDAVDAYRLVGFENRAIPDDDFRDDNVDAGAIGAGHEVTALYALRLNFEGDRQSRLGTVVLRWTEPASTRTNEIARDVRASDLAASFDATAATFRLDAIVAATAERFRGSPLGRTYDLASIAEIANAMSPELPRTDQVHAFLDLLDRAARIER